MAFNHPHYIEASVDRVRKAFNEIPASRKSKTHFVFTAHSIPLAMAEGCKYSTQLNESCRLIMEHFGDNPWDLVFQSRSGPPTQPWLEPDVCDFLRELKQKTDITDVVLMPVGFVSDHMEVLFDLDTEAKDLCEELGINMVRAKTVGVHPKFISMIRELVLERTIGAEKLAIGNMPPNWDVCPVDCCTYERPTRPSSSQPAVNQLRTKTANLQSRISSNSVEWRFVTLSELVDLASNHVVGRRHCQIDWIAVELIGIARLRDDGSRCRLVGITDRV